VKGKQTEGEEISFFF